MSFQHHRKRARLICLSPLLYSIQLASMKFFRDLANWYFSRSVLPYWSILLLNCMFMVFAVVLAFTVHHTARGRP